MPNILDKWDIAVSIGSGALTAALDVLWIKNISLADAHSWGTEKVNDFVKNVAKSNGYVGNDLAGAVKKLEADYPMDGDLLTNEFGGGYQHHLRDFSHHPTPVGLLFSILMQFTGKGYGTDGTGKFQVYEIKDWKSKKPEEAIYLGTVGWLLHIVSDIAGSSGTIRKSGEGTGLPGPMMAFLKEISSVPGLRNIMGRADAHNTPNKAPNYLFSEKCSKLFNGTLLGEHDENGKIVSALKFDLRTEIGIVNESIKNKQHIPVLLNSLIVSSFYSVRRLIDEIEHKGLNSVDSLNQIDVAKCLPWKNEPVRHMRMISAATFSTIDLSAAGIKAALKNKDNPSGFALDFMQGINYWGLGSLALATNSEVLTGIQNMHTTFVSMADTQKQKLLTSIPNGKQTLETAKLATEMGVAIGKLGTPAGFVAAAIGVYDEIQKAITELKVSIEERTRIEEECTARIVVIKENRALMQETVEGYFDRKLSVFTEAFRTMDQAISMNDVDAFIIGNNMIQSELSGKVMFENREEFDSLMSSDSAIKF